MRAIFAVVFAVGFVVLSAPSSARVFHRIPHCQNCYKVLNTDIKNAAKKSMTAVVRAGLDLTKMRDEFADQQSNLETNLKKAKAMSELIKKKIGESVKAIESILEDANKKVKDKMSEVLVASDALSDLEKKVDAKKVTDEAQKIRNKIAKGKPIKDKQQKEILKQNGVIATLNAAKILAKARAKQAIKKIEAKKAVVRDDIARLEDNMSNVENDLVNEEQQEIEDEREARSKIQEAVHHNKAALNKAREFLMSVENGIQKFHEDIAKVREISH